MRIEAAARMVAEGPGAVRDWEASAGYARTGWDRFRKDITLRPPPGPLPVAPTEGLLVLVDAARAAPALLRATLVGLQDQSVRDWRALIVANDRLRAHPVGGFAELDGRIAFGDLATIAADRAALIAPVTAGTVLHPEALAWLLFARERTGAGAVYADQDRGMPHPLRGLDYAEPRLFGAFDRDFTLRSGPPALALVDRLAFDDVQVADGPLGSGLRRGALLAAADAGAVAHVPRVLATVLEIPIPAAGGPDAPDDGAPDCFGDPEEVVAPAPPPRSDDVIAVIIPTRDNPMLLRRAVESFRRTAADPTRLRFVLVDNRNADAAAIALLDELRLRPDVKVVTMDEPFNWSRANNAGVAAAQGATLLVFANDDVEMRSPGWDDALAAVLAREDVGAVGARLRYPDGTVQHAGIVFGTGEGGPEHEGRYAAAGDPGPDGRWIARRSVAAVTGALLGVRRERLDAVGGFDDARLFIAYNDLDLCLKLRARGWRIVYEPAIEALHRESASRGFDVTRAQVMWDLGERRDLLARWGSALGWDPGLNPYWTRHGRPFDGLREPPMHEVLAHIDRSARRDPWNPIAAGTA
jgi:GT2 family glycosyltransferase